VSTSLLYNFMIDAENKSTVLALSRIGSILLLSFVSVANY
jgi:hypothetical protein